MVMNFKLLGSSILPTRYNITYQVGNYDRPVALLRFANNLVERRRKRRVKALHAPSKDFGHLLERGAYLYSSYYFEMLAVENLARVE